ncbi:hypothetical protein [Streptomyces vinaceus]|uniref:hypothetical protein n=1 Tax=Streptomyces vinaceus TaxID=1960 RepID=UPI0036C7B4E5
MSSLPPFSGDEPTCAKCGWTGASTEYLPMGDCVHSPGDRGVTLGWAANERLHRECQRCRYAWDEAIVEPGLPCADPEPDGVLHAQRRHPDWEYATTEGPRKRWDGIDVPPCDDNGDPDPTWERNLDAGHPGEGWERFDYTEESYWRRPKRPGTSPAERPTRPVHADGTPYRYAEIVAEGWSCCDACHRWGRTWTPEQPHICPNEPKAATS